MRQKEVKILTQKSSTWITKLKIDGCVFQKVQMKLKNSFYNTSNKTNNLIYS